MLRHLVNQEGRHAADGNRWASPTSSEAWATRRSSAATSTRSTSACPRTRWALESVFDSGILINKEDLIAAAIAAGLMVRCSPCSSRRPPPGRAAVADDHQAAQSIGIPLSRIWVIVWCVAGVVALVAGMIWGSKLGVQFSLTTLACALPVVILGGLTSVPGAIIGGDHRRGRSCRVYLGHYVAAASRSGSPMCFGAGVPAGPAAGACSAKDHRPRG